MAMTEQFRTRAPRAAVNEMLRTSLPVLNGLSADCGDILDELQLRELDEPGDQYEREIQKARAIRRIALEVQEGMRKLARALEAEEQIRVGRLTQAQSPHAA